MSLIHSTFLEHLVIIRTGGSLINLESYNCQEFGLAKALTKRGLKVTIILAGTKNETKTFNIGTKTIVVYYVRFKHINQALAWFENIEHLLHLLKPTCIQIHEFGMLMSYRIIKWAKRNNTKTYLIQGSYRTTSKPVLKQLEIIFNITFGRYILSNVNGIGCKSSRAAQYIKSYAKKEITPTYIGLDTDKFQNAITKDWIKELNIRNKKILLYIGILENRRNPLFLLSIIESLPNNYVLIIVGSGSMETKIKCEIDTKKLWDRCFMLGKLKQEELPSIYKIADIFLLASDYEIYGMVILEAMFFKVPVISTPNAGSEVIIDNYKNGVILPHKDIMTWGQTIINLCSDKTMLSKMKDEANMKIVSKLTWEQAVNAFLTLYNIR